MGYWEERNIPYKPGQKTPYKLSRSKIELFMQCQRCFWLDVRKKITRPSTPPFNINKTIDELFKKEFDKYRKSNKPHPLMVEFGVDAVPFAHEDIDKWRENFVGVAYIHPDTNLHIFGAIDDIWVDKKGRVIVVDYKATSKDRDVNIDADWQIAYKRQMETYQWLLRQNGFEVNDKGYFVYANGRVDVDDFKDRVEFRTKLIPYKGNDSWVEPTIQKMKKCMDSETMPPVGKAAMGGDCEYCLYAKARTKLTLDSLQKK